MIISTHASHQMTARGIGRSNILAVLIDGREILTGKPGIVRRELEGLVVVLDEVRGVVVTAFHREEKKRRKVKNGLRKMQEQGRHGRKGYHLRKANLAISGPGQEERSDDDFMVD